MDALSYINSNAIKRHLKEIGYSFNSLEMAWLIYSCNKLSYEEKKGAWIELIAEMPDCVVPERANCKGWSSLHDFLRQYINIMDSEIEEFYRDEQAGSFVYMYSYLYKDDQRWTEKYETVYQSLKSCIEAFQEDVNDLDETYSPNVTGVIKYRIKKQSLLDTTIVYEIECRGDGKVTDILRNSVRDSIAEEIISNSFEGMWFDIPTPFKEGDIVWVPTDTNKIKWDCDGGFVLLGLSTWNASDYMKESGDNSDMNGYGYFVNDNGTIYHEVMYNYMDLEFYTGPYKLNEKILPALSKFVKGDIDVAFLLCAYRKVLLDVAADDVMLKNWYSQEMVKELGLL